MDPERYRHAVELNRLPRSRGDGPPIAGAVYRFVTAAPLTRGWTLLAGSFRHPLHGCPAHAGMDPTAPAVRWWAMRAAPLTRGWTQRHQRHHGCVPGCPAHAGMDPCPAVTSKRVARAAPLTRGWTPVHAHRGRQRRGCPAHAGMDPLAAGAWEWSARLPRSRGDGPSTGSSRPRLRPAAPLTRGWTPDRAQQGQAEPGCPAHAGMDPTAPTPPAPRWRLPRSRGDGPDALRAVLTTDEAAPLTRGWTRCWPALRLKGRGCPAHAGMDPTLVLLQVACSWLPRSRGDGPPALRRGLGD